MDNPQEDKNHMEKDDMSNIIQFFKSINEGNQYLSFFNENLYLEHSIWLDNVKSEIKKAINNSDKDINISDINYSNSIIYLIKKIADPHNFRNSNEIFEKIDEFDNFNDIIMEINTCSKHKKKFLLLTKNKKNIISNENINKNINYNDFNDYLNEDIKIDNSNIKDEKEKLLIFNNFNSTEANEEENELENSLYTITEQPSIEDLDKITISPKSINLFNSNHIINKKNNKINSQKFENNKNNYILDSNIRNNNKNSDINIVENKIYPYTDNKKYKPLKIHESIAIASQKRNNSPISQTFNNNINIQDNHENQFDSQQKSPYFIKIKNNENSSIKDNILLEDSNSINSNKYNLSNKKNDNN